MKARIAAVVTAMGLLAIVGCASDQEGVKTNKLSQWTTVAADTVTTTDAAKAVLEDEGLLEVTAASTKVDGKASGKKSDGTWVKVGISKETDTTSKVSVGIGVMGDSTLGAEIARKIKVKAENLK